MDQTGAEFMRMAIDLAVTNVTSGAGGPFGAVIVKDGAVLATGVNRVTAGSDPTAHAEVMAIRAAAQLLGHFELTGCTAKDAAATGFDDAFIYEEIDRPFGERRVKTECVMRDEAAASFKAWSEFTGRIEY